MRNSWEHTWICIPGEFVWRLRNSSCPPPLLLFMPLRWAWQQSQCNLEPNVLLGLKIPPVEPLCRPHVRRGRSPACSVLAIGSNRPEVIAFRPLLPWRPPPQILPVWRIDRVAKLSMKGGGGGGGGGVGGGGGGGGREGGGGGGGGGGRYFKIRDGSSEQRPRGSPSSCKPWISALLLRPSVRGDSAGNLWCRSFSSPPPAPFSTEMARRCSY